MHFEILKSIFYHENLNFMVREAYIRNQHNFRYFPDVRFVDKLGKIFLTSKMFFASTSYSCFGSITIVFSGFELVSDDIFQSFDIFRVERQAPLLQKMCHIQTFFCILYDDETQTLW